MSAPGTPATVLWISFPGSRTGIGLQLRNLTEPWFVWLSGLSASLKTKGSPVQFPVEAHAWVVGQVSGEGHTIGKHTLMFLSLSFSFPSPLLNK